LRRIDDPDDFVRIEIEAALQRNVRVIPVLVDGAAMPKASELPESLKGFARRQGTEVSPARFEADVEKLTHALVSILDERRRRDEVEAVRQLEEERQAREATETARAAREEREGREAAEANRAEEARQKAEAARRQEEERRAKEAADAERGERERREVAEAARAEETRRVAEAEATRRGGEERSAKEAADAARAERGGEEPPTENAADAATAQKASLIVPESDLTQYQIDARRWLGVSLNSRPMEANAEPDITPEQPYVWRQAYVWTLMLGVVISVLGLTAQSGLAVLLGIGLLVFAGYAFWRREP
jgi:hypothetical protein